MKENHHKREINEINYIYFLLYRIGKREIIVYIYLNNT